MLVLWVDDILAIATSASGMNDIHFILEEKYQLHNMGDLADYLGLQVTRDHTHGLLFVNQVSYAKMILHKFHLSDCMPIISPALSIEILVTSTMIATPKQRLLYQAMIESLMWLTIWT